MKVAESSVNNGSVSHLFIPALVIALASTSLAVPLFYLNLMDVAKTFHVTVGTAGQALAIGRFVSLFVGLALGIISIRFRRRSLYFLGLGLVALGYLGAYFANNFASFLLFISIHGAGQPMVGIISVTLVGEFLPLEKRGRAAGYLASALYLGLFFGYPVTGMVANAFGWKSVITLWMLPVVLLGLVLSIPVLRSNLAQKQPPARMSYAGAFKQVLSNKSAMACVLATMCAFTLAQVHAYTATYYRQHFSVPLLTVSLIAVFGTGLAVCGTIIGGRIVNPARRKPLIVVTSLLAGLGTMAFLFMPYLWYNLALDYSSTLVFGIAEATLLALVLEQVPKVRSTVMSLRSALGLSLGATLGVYIGGWVLNFTKNNFQLLGITLGAFGVAEAAIVLFLTKEPSKMPPQPETQEKVAQLI